MAPAWSLAFGVNLVPSLSISGFAWGEAEGLGSFYAHIVTLLR